LNPARGLGSAVSSPGRSANAFWYILRLGNASGRNNNFNGFHTGMAVGQRLVHGYFSLGFQFQL